MDNAIEAQSYLAAIVTSSDDAIISKDLHGNITSWNGSAERIFGYSAEEAVGRHISILIPTEYLSDEDYIISRIRAGKRVEHFETVRQRKNGERIDVSVTISPIKNSAGIIIGASKVARDVTAIRISERHSAYYRAIVDSSDDAIISKNLDGVIISWNQGAERILGYTADEIIGHHITRIIPEELLAEEEKIMALLRSGERIDHIETAHRHKDGHVVPLSVTISPIRDGSGRIVGASKVARDISERHKLEAALNEMNRRKDEFLANVSHELRTPMNVVIGLRHLLALSRTLSEKDRTFVDTLKLNADGLMKLIDDLLDFARIESGAIQLEEVEFDLADLIAGAVKIMGVKAEEKRLMLAAHYGAPSSLFRGDPVRINQIVMNLLSNAVKFTDHGSIEIGVEAKEMGKDGVAQVSLKVRDTGIGIAIDKQKSVFEKFTQADASINRRFGGSGLGLSIARALAGLMGGRIDLESAPGLGSTFTVTVPLRTAGRTQAVPAAAGSNRPAGRGRVLLVEDYEDSVLVATEMLEHFGYDCDVACNGPDALRKFGRGKYDVVLMDVQMNGMDGFETARRIRSFEQDQGRAPTAIIAMTAHVRERDKSQCIDAGMDDFIAKPFDPSALSSMISHYASPLAKAG